MAHESAGLRYVREWISKCSFQDYILFQMHHQKEKEQAS